MDRLIKDKVKQIVTDYKELFPGEFAMFQKQIADFRAQLTDKQFGTISGDHAMERAVHEMPDTLFGMITKTLTDEELNQFTGTDSASQKKAARWFAKTFPEFALPTHI